MVRNTPALSELGHAQPDNLSFNRYEGTREARHGEINLSPRERIQCGGRLHHFEPEADAKGRLRDDEPRDPRVWCDLGLLERDSASRPPTTATTIINVSYVLSGYGVS